MRYIKFIFSLSILTIYLYAGDASKGLIDHMSLLQRFTHKLSLSIDAKNIKLAQFYIHEVEEIIEELDKIEYYHKVPVKKLNRTFLEPAFKTVKKVIKEENWKQMDRAINTMIESCNQCHRASQFDYIKIVRTHKNPFMQSFKFP